MSHCKDVPFQLPSKSRKSMAQNGKAYTFLSWLSAKLHKSRDSYRPCHSCLKHIKCFPFNPSSTYPFCCQPPEQKISRPVLERYRKKEGKETLAWSTRIRWILFHPYRQKNSHSIYGWSFHVILTSHPLVGLQQWLAAGIRAHHHL